MCAHKTFPGATHVSHEPSTWCLVTTPRVSQAGELWWRWHSPGPAGDLPRLGELDSGVTGSVTLVTICDDTSLVSCIPSTSVVSAPDYAPSHPLARVTIHTPDSRLQHKNVTVAMNKERSGINCTNLHEHGHGLCKHGPLCGVQHQCSVICHAVWRDTTWRRVTAPVIDDRGINTKKAIVWPGRGWNQNSEVLRSNCDVPLG